MRLLVIGRSGQVATELRRRGAARGHAVTALGRDACDLSRPDRLAEALAGSLDTAEAVVNAAAWTAVDAAEAEEAAARALNAEGPGELARLCAARGLPLLHVSTDYVFDGAGTAPWRPDDTPAPLSAYGRTKLEGERAVQAAGGPHAILRTSWVFSAHGANFVKSMLRLGAERPALRVVADQIGGPTPAAAIADALTAMAAALAGGAPGGLFHFAGTPDVGWAGFAREIFRQAGLTTDVEEIGTADWPTPAPRPANSRLDCSATEAAFGIARPDWRAGLAEVLAELGTRKES